MINKFALAAFIISLQTASFACRYTVREIGFADFGADSYHLWLFKDDRIADDDAALFQKTANAALMDANIAADVFHVQGSDSLGLLQYYNKNNNGHLPNAVLISPDKKSRLFFFDENQDFMESVWTMLEKIVASPARTKLLQSIVPSYAVVYFIDGPDKKENKRTHRELENAVSRIRMIMSDLPKPASQPPALIRVKQSEINEEEILLWSLGWRPADRPSPAVAVMYGRGRLMGALLKGNEITENIIENMLRYVGADCECGLDRSWMLGTMIPLRWDSQRQEAVLHHYGFDAENPMVVSEMSQILSVVPNNQNAKNSGALYGYNEGVLDLTTTTAQNKDENKPMAAAAFDLKKSFLLILAAFALILLIGVGLYLRAQRRNY